MIARRQPNFGGNYDLHYDYLPDTNAQFAAYDGAYAATTSAARCGGSTRARATFEPLVDVPGHGRHLLPGDHPRSPGRYLVYNYTSPLDGPDEPWGTALLHGPTQIYRTTLVF